MAHAPRGVDVDFVPWLTGMRGEDFTRDHWERAVLHVPRNDPSYYESVTDLEALDRFLTTQTLPASSVDLAKDSEPIPKEMYAAGGELRIGRVLRLHRDGATIILRAAHRFSAPLQDLRARAEASLGAPAQVNIYITPPGHQSTPPHWDTHDLFILQIAGTKNWRLFASNDRLPLDDWRFTPDRFHLGELVRECHLQPGDVLYLPRGTIHEPRPEAYSIHVALGVLVTRWADVLSEAVRVSSEKHVSLRAAADLGSVVDDGPADDQLDELLHDVFEGGAIVEAARRLEERFLASREPQYRGTLVAVSSGAPLTPSSRVGRRSATPYRIARENGYIRLAWSRGSATFDVEHEPFVRFIAESPDFAIADAPGTADPGTKVAAIAALIEDGFLERPG
jgi:hypothetical protein